jgi:hypothetical protein
VGSNRGLPKSQNGLWVPFDLLECSFRREQIFPRVFIDGDGPNVFIASGRPELGYVTLSFFHVKPPYRTRLISNMICYSTCPVWLDALYPLESSSYTSWDEKTYAVPCTIFGAAVNSNLSYDCPDGYVPPRDESDLRPCIQVIAVLLFVFTCECRVPPPMYVVYIPFIFLSLLLLPGLPS